jgi:hypothetical protein
MVASAAGAVGVLVGVAVVAGIASVLVPAIAIAVTVAVAVAAAALPTVHREIHRTCCQSGEDISYTQGTRGNQTAVQRRWINQPDGSHGVQHVRYEQGPVRNENHEPHMIQRAVLGELLRSLVPVHSTVTIRISTGRDRR